MINDHSNGPSSSVHGSSRVDEGLEPPDLLVTSESASDAVAMVKDRLPVWAQPDEQRQGSRNAGHGSAMAQVAILMCTYNGEAFLEQQLESIRRQRWSSWFMAVSDDGSVDDTLHTVARYQAMWGADKVSLWQGPRRGFARNFMSCIANRNLEAEFYAWCDQDDIWHEDKLHKAVCWLRSVPAGKPALYLGRTELIGVCGEPLGYSPLFKRPPSFANALVQNIGGGNTMVFNHAARCLLQDAARHLDLLSLEIVSHDWWAYLLMTGVGAEVFYDAQPYVRYRQHDRNLVGSNADWHARLLRMRMLLQGRFRDWNTINITALEAVKLYLTPENRELLEQFKALRTQPLITRLRSLRRQGLYRQTLLGNLGLIFATAIKAV